jgi:hypothetical protein
MRARTNLTVTTVRVHHDHRVPQPSRTRSPLVVALLVACVACVACEQSNGVAMATANVDDEEMRCLERNGDGIARDVDDEAPDVDDARGGVWDEELDAAMRMDTCTPTLAALATSFHELIDVH